MTAVLRILAISGGVGGAKLCQGLSRLCPGENLDVLVNTADDFQHLGLHISPDIDTMLYTLAGRNDTERGWGLKDESWQMQQALEALGGETWFQLGDRDLATHLWRTQQLMAGQSLSEATAALGERLGVTANIHPMSDDPVQTLVHTCEGALPFQHYFVKHRCEPTVTGFDFEGIAAARLNAAVFDLLTSGTHDGIVLCPSNPFVSLGPVLRVEDFWQRLRDAPAPVVAVSPIVAGHAIKGPAGKILAELALPVSAFGVAQYYHTHYPGLVDEWVIDNEDRHLAEEIEALGMGVIVTDTVMTGPAEQLVLARTVLSRMPGT